jgi:hypothetical protein
MALTPGCLVNVGGLDIPFVHKLVISQSWKSITQTARLFFPDKIRVDGTPLRDVLKPGQKVVIYLGYYGELHKEFEGYISRVHPKVPLEVELEDEMYNYKRVPVSKSWKNLKLKELITELMPQVEIGKVADVALGTVRVNKSTPAKVFEDIKSKFGIPFYFHAGKFYAGLPYLNESRIIDYDFDNTVIKNDLVFKSNEEFRIQVEGISNKTDGQKLRFKTGDPDGELRTLNYLDISEAELKEAVERDFKKLKFDGYRGNFTTWGYPRIYQGAVAKIIDPGYPERAGNYYSDTVETEFGLAGYRRKIELGPKA